MRQILITGGAGFVGRYFCRYFLEQGDSVTCVDPIVKGTGGLSPEKGWPLFNPNKYPHFYFYDNDCREFFKWGWKEEAKFDLVLHLAAMVCGRKVMEEQPLIIADDLSIDSAFWQWAAKSKPNKIVYFSSSAAYPVDLQTKKYNRLLRENDISLDDPALGMPDMTYGWAKLTGEYLARFAYKYYGLKSVIYRPFSGYGEDQDLSYPVPAICKRVIEHDNENSQGRFQIWGSGLQVRDFIHIDDVVEGVIKTMDQVNDASAINLSTGIGTNFIDLATYAGDIAKKQFHVETEPNTPEGVFARVGDVRLQESYEFIPKINLKEGLARVLKYLGQNG